MGFKNIERQGVRPGRTIQFELIELALVDGRRPTLLVEHYSVSNPTVIGEMIMGAGGVEPAIPPKPPESEVEAAAAWELGWQSKRDTLSKHCIRAVENLYHDGADGEPDLSRPAGVADVPELLLALPLEALIRLFSFCVNPENFKDAGKTKVADVAKK